MNGREEKQSNDVFFVCSLIGYMARKTKNRPADIVDALGKTRIRKLLDLAEVYHSDNIDAVSDSLIREAGIAPGRFDNISTAKYGAPGFWDIGKVYKRLVLGIAKEKQIPVVDALWDAYHSFVSDKIENYNSAFYYDNPQNILNAYFYGLPVA